MKIVETILNGIFVIETDIFQDERGSFTKIFHKDFFKKNNITSNIFLENYFSISHKNVIRGMHFQIPTEDHEKIVYVTKGSITDVVLDIRKNSPTYGKYQVMEISDKNHRIIFIPKGFAHGFLSLEDDTCVVYLQTTMYSKEHDTGIRFDSFGMDWDVENPIISKRDQSFQKLEDFITPFI
ncbi:MAG: dTDP-4-dehydrorhamnose 3,5-epimerase [Candidatus Paceibacterota bacterium]|jgi:dTDP-4-dehydrorhamnose 3,5-epimerase